jgi:hypothetical protein
LGSAWHSRRPHQRHCGTGIWRDRDIAAGWRDLKTSCASLPTRSPSHRAQPRGKPGFLTLESSSGRETDSPLEGTGFEPSVPRERDDGLHHQSWGPSDELGRPFGPRTGSDRVRKRSGISTCSPPMGHFACLGRASSVVPAKEDFFLAVGNLYAFDLFCRHLDNGRLGRTSADIANIERRIMSAYRY